MATQTRARPTSAARKLPDIDVARLEEVGYLLERLVAENTELFVAKGQQYREAHRDGTRRTLSVDEAVQLAASIVDDARPVEDRAAALQSHEGLYAYDQPGQVEVLVAAGVATAPAFVRACRQAVALLEMPTNVFWEAIDDDRLQEAIDEAAAQLRHVPLVEARERTAAALDHFASQAGDAGGKGLALLGRTIRAALEQAMAIMQSDGSAFSSLIASPEPEATAGAAASSSS